eukprot:scaffold307_cov390-Prasinococcus_capsulatus_cf.AAC.41
MSSHTKERTLVNQANSATSLKDSVRGAQAGEASAHHNHLRHSWAGTTLHAFTSCTEGSAPKRLLQAWRVCEAEGGRTGAHICA